MPLDHYISQVHLRKFYSPALGNRMYAVRKTDLKVFTPDSQAVCRIMDGSTNAYLREDRAIEDFLKTVEPNYNAALDKLIAGEIDNECIYTIAGFVAYVTTCSPSGMRIHSGSLKSTVETTAPIIEAQGLLPSPPPQLGGVSLGISANLLYGFEQFNLQNLISLPSTWRVECPRHIRACGRHL